MKEAGTVEKEFLAAASAKLSPGEVIYFEGCELLAACQG